MEEVIITEVVKILINQFSAPIITQLKKIKLDTVDKLKVSLNLSFTEYLERSYERHSKTKTLLYRDMPVNLRDFYVRTDLKINKKKISGDDFVSRLEKNKRVIVSGNAGCGKSTFCKSVFIELIEEPRGIFPIFIELRHLNNSLDKSLYTYILKEMTNVSPSFNESQLEYALKLGKVLIILDGFDEINNNERYEIEKEILELSNNHSGIRLLISSRFDSRFESWSEFYQYKIQPLNKSKAIELIDKLDYDEIIKKKFKEELELKLFLTHESFASNPLLLTLMLLTYEQIAEIPNKMHLFYEQAFITLFNKHDSFKSLYKRKILSELSLDDFKKVLEIFCLYSFCERNYYFENKDINKYLHESIKVSKINVNMENFLSDLLDAVCLLQRDGLGFTFTHRSFQEYFTASFLVNKTMSGKFKLFEKIFTLSFQDNVIDMVQDMNQNLLEKEWIIPKIEAILKSINSISEFDSNKELEIFSMFFSSIERMVEDDTNETIVFGMGGSSNKFAHFFHKLTQIYKKDYLELLDEKSEFLEGNKHFKELLLERLYEDGDINLSEIGRIDPFVKELIKKSEILNVIQFNIDFLNRKLKALRKEHEELEEDIFSLIFN